MIDHINDSIDDHSRQYNDDNIELFSSSQSPIVPATTRATTYNHSPLSTHQKNYRRTTSIEVDDDVFFGDKHSYNSCDSDASTTPPNPNHAPRPQYENDSLVETTMLVDNKHVHWDYDHTLIKDAPTDVRLRHGETIRYPKLTTLHTRPTIGTTTNSTTRVPALTQSYPDPFRLYEEKVQKQLNRVYTKMMMHRDRRTLRQCGAVLAVTEQHVTDLVLKLHLDHPVLEDRTNNDNTKNAPLRGKTLIVARSKDGLDTWRRTFREGSGLSVVNHASMSITQRKHPTCSAQLIHSDIVLSTYDAIKSPDLAMKIDTTTGLAVTHTDLTSTDGWYTAPSAMPSQQHQDSDGRAVVATNYTTRALSAAHKLRWNRILLVDVLGRKGYMTKADTTARVQAVRALNADTRWMFFVPSNDTVPTNAAHRTTSVTSIDRNTLCDRPTLLSLACTLRHPVSNDDNDDNVDIAKLRQEIVFDFST